jgi:hypothetical protein
VEVDTGSNITHNLPLLDSSMALITKDSFNFCEYGGFMKFLRPQSLMGRTNNTKGTIWIQNESSKKFKRVSVDELEEYLSIGWYRKSPRDKDKFDD